MMKTLFMLLAFCGSMLTASAQTKESKAPDKNKKMLLVEASCGQCQFKLEGTDCDLAVRIDGKAYFVDGSNIDSHGDAHASDGFCNAIRKAKVQGEVVDGRFKATYFQLLPEDPKKPKSN
jgi:hypothetical protein